MITNNCLGNRAVTSCTNQYIMSLLIFTITINLFFYFVLDLSYPRQISVDNIEICLYSRQCLLTWKNSLSPHFGCLIFVASLFSSLGGSLSQSAMAYRKCLNLTRILVFFYFLKKKLVLYCYSKTILLLWLLLLPFCFLFVLHSSCVVDTPCLVGDDVWCVPSQLFSP